MSSSFQEVSTKLTICARLLCNHAWNWLNLIIWQQPWTLRGKGKSVGFMKIMIVSFRSTNNSDQNEFQQADINFNNLIRNQKYLNSAFSISPQPSLEFTHNPFPEGNNELYGINFINMRQNIESIRNNKPWAKQVYNIHCNNVNMPKKYLNDNWFPIFHCLLQITSQAYYRNENKIKYFTSIRIAWLVSVDYLF